MNKWTDIIILLIATLVFCTFVFLYINNDTENSILNLDTNNGRDDTATLEVRGNKIVLRDSQEIIRLKGAVSDFFRYGRNHDIAYEDISAEFRGIKKLQELGINTIGLYMSDFKKIKENISILDAYVLFSEQNNLYLYMIPVAREFSEGYYPVSWSPEPEDDNDLTSLIGFLSNRYKDKNNILYGFGAEPDFPSSHFDYWYEKQKQLATIVRSNNPNALLLVTGVVQYGLTDFLENPFPFDNIIFLAGGYLTEDDVDYEKRIANSKTTIEELVQKKIDNNALLGEQYPILVSEYGGNVSSDFSSEYDLLMIQKYTKMLNLKELSYTAYRLMPRFPDDSLSIFDESGALTKRGESFFNL